MKKIICLLLSLCCVLTAIIAALPASAADSLKTAAEALSEYRQKTGKAVETIRYYFLLPNGNNCITGKDGKKADSWKNDQTDSAGIYWWSGNTYMPESWPGYAAIRVGSTDMFYADIPLGVTNIIWNNILPDGDLSRQSQMFEIGIDNGPDYPVSYLMNNAVFVVDPDNSSVNPLSNRVEYSLEFYEYYGEDHFGKDHECLNAEHQHDGETFTEPTVAPETDPVTEPNTEADTEAVTEPQTEAGTEIATEAEITKLGDADGDGGISILDATVIQRHLADLTNESFNEAAADVDGDNIVTILDATQIQRHLAGLSASDKIDKPIA